MNLHGRLRKLLLHMRSRVFLLIETEKKTIFFSTNNIFFLWVSWIWCLLSPKKQRMCSNVILDILTFTFLLICKILMKRVMLKIKTKKLVISCPLQTFEIHSSYTSYNNEKFAKGMNLSFYSWLSLWTSYKWENCKDKMSKMTLERYKCLLGLNKNHIKLNDKGKMLLVEKHIVLFLIPNQTEKATSTIKEQLPQSFIQLQKPQSLNGHTNPAMQHVQGLLHGVV